MLSERVGSMTIPTTTRVLSMTCSLGPGNIYVIRDYDDAYINYGVAMCSPSRSGSGHLLTIGSSNWGNCLAYAGAATELLTRPVVCIPH